MFNEINSIHDLSQGQAIVAMGLTFVVSISLLEFFGTRLGWKAEIRRKLMHLVVGMICILVPYRFTSHWVVFSSTVTFTVGLWLVNRFNKIAAFSKIGRVSHGVIFFPLAIYLNYLLYLHYNFDPLNYLPLLILTISDPLAYFTGKAFKSNKKSIPGSIGFLVSALISSWLFLSIISFDLLLHKIILTLVIAAVGTLSEGLSGKGWDNLTIPLALGGVLVVYQELILDL